MTSKIVLRGATLDFPVLDASARSLRANVLDAVGGRARADRQRVFVRALDGIDLEVVAGERLGIVGPNGSGKTSLLRMLAGIFEATEGTVQVTGRVTSLLDLTAGFDIEATGYENIFLRSKLLGCGHREIDAIRRSVEEVSELGQFLAMPVRTYSSGMLMRLAFALATARPADILLMDEWLAVGDADYLAKAEAIVRRMIESSGILVMASHSEALLKLWCNRTIRLERGRISS